MRPVASPLFQGLSAEEWAALEQSGCLRTKSYPRHAVIFHAGAQVHALGVVLRGTVHIENLDLWGSKSILSSISAGQAFAETYAFCGEALMVDAVAAEHCEILFLHTAALTDARIEPALKDKLLRRLLAVSMRKNLSLSQRIFCTTPKTVRGRLLTYFSAQAARSGSLQFEIPFNRQQLADYLNLDRSALSKELCKMRDEGLLTFEKNRFALNELPE
jgi:CRP-like cAMP-binding protein